MTKWLVVLLLLGGCRNVVPSKPAPPFSIWERSLGGTLVRKGPWTVGAPIAEPKEGRAFVQPDLDAPIPEIVAAIAGAPVRGLSLNGHSGVNDATVGALGVLRGQLTFLDLGATPLTDIGAVPLLAALEGLLHLNLSETKIGDRTLAVLTHSTLAALDVSSTRVTRFDALPVSLVELAANQTRIGDDSAPAIAKLTALQVLDLNHTRLSELGVASFSTMPGLRRLGLASTGADDDALVILEGMPGLDALSLAGTRLTDRGLLHLRGLTHLGVLNLSDTAVSDEGLNGIEQAQNLTALGLASTRITDVTLARIGQLAALRALDVSATRTTDVGITALVGLLELRELSLSQTGLTDTGLRALDPLKKLERLELDKTAITELGLATIATRPLKQLTLANTKIGPKALPILAALSKLEWLDLSGNTFGKSAAWNLLGGMQTLETLSLNDTDLPASSAGALADLERLRVLELRSTGINDGFAVPLARLKQLRTLGLAYTDVGDVTVAVASTLPHLGTLRLNATRLGATGIRRLAAAPQLVKLDLALCALDDEAVLSLGGSCCIEILGLSGTQITAAGLARLPSTVRQLVLNQVPVGDAAMDALLKLRALEWVDARGAKLSPAAVARLEAAGVMVKE
jgi:Leucine-rich repeat (LRR) protein